MPSKHRSRSIAPGVRRVGEGFEVRVNCGAARQWQNFPAGTPMRDIKRWQTMTKAAMLASAGRPVPPRRPRSVLRPADVDAPFAYVYFIADDRDRVKIGRAVDVAERLSSLQTSHAAPLRVLAAVRVIMEAERVLHRRFAEHRLQGEWFRLVPEIDAVIRYLQEGGDLASLLWPHGLLAGTPAGTFSIPLQHD